MSDVGDQHRRPSEEKIGLKMVSSSQNEQRFEIKWTYYVLRNKTHT